MLQAPAEAIHTPSHDDIDLAARGGHAHRIELGPLVTALGAADTLINELGYDKPA
jgi:hypothetical protein